jgi:hypothetical protein
MPETTDTVKATLNTKIKTSLEELRKLMETSNIKDMTSAMNDKINKIIYELQSLVARIPAQQPAPITTPVAKADDAAVPEFWRRNRDYGEK